MLRWVNKQQTFNTFPWLPRFTKRHDAALQRRLARDELVLAVHRVVTTPSYDVQVRLVGVSHI